MKFQALGRFFEKTSSDSISDIGIFADQFSQKLQKELIVVKVQTNVLLRFSHQRINRQVLTWKLVLMNNHCFFVQKRKKNW